MCSTATTGRGPRAAMDEGDTGDTGNTSWHEPTRHPSSHGEDKGLVGHGGGPQQLECFGKEGQKQKGVRLPGALPPPFTEGPGPDVSPGLVKKVLKDKFVPLS